MSETSYAGLITTVAVLVLPVLLAITLHEAAHALAAKHFGDATAFLMGRVTLNPLKHIDPVGTVVLPLLLYFLSGGALAFGYAKPVPVNINNLRNPKVHMAWVALAGPLCNLIQALIWTVLLGLIYRTGLHEAFFLDMARAGVLVNLSLMALNLFPIPPLDGGRIAVGLLPWSIGRHLAQFEPYGFFIVLGLLALRVFDTFWMLPILHFFDGVIQAILRLFLT